MAAIGAESEGDLLRRRKAAESPLLPMLRAGRIVE